MRSSEHKVAKALRLVALRLEWALEEGRRTRRIGAEDLRNTLLGVADKLDPSGPHKDTKGAREDEGAKGQDPLSTPD